MSECVFRFFFALVFFKVCIYILFQTTSTKATGNVDREIRNVPGNLLLRPTVNEMDETCQVRIRQLMMMLVVQ